MARAFAPGNISCVFKVIPHLDATRMHSLGMGFTVTEGVEVTVSDYHETEVLFNGEDINFPTVRAVVDRLIQNTEITGIKVNLTSPYLSAAASDLAVPLHSQQHTPSTSSYICVKIQSRSR